MPVSTTIRKTTPAAGNSSNKTWTFAFKTLNADTVIPYLIDSDGVATEITSDFTVSLNADQETSPGGSVTYPVVAAAITSASSVQVVRETPVTQNLDMTFGGTFDDEDVEAALDRIVTQLQEISEAVSRAIKLKPGDQSGATLEVGTPVANYVVTVNAAGDGFTLSQSVATSVTISSYAENNILNLADAAALLALVGGLDPTTDNVYTGENAFLGIISINKGTDLTTTDIAAGVLTLPGDGNFYDFTDATDFSEIAVDFGNVPVLIHFSAGGNTLTHDATDLPLIGGADIVTEAGDLAGFIQYAAGDWRMVSYHRASGKPLVASDIVSGTTGASFALNLQCNSNTQVVVTATDLILEDSAGAQVKASISSGIVDITASGANGLDTSDVEGASKWYPIYVIYNPTTDTVALLLSDSYTLPTLPSGYTYKTRVGSVRNDGSSNFVHFNQMDSLVAYRQEVLAKNGSCVASTWTGITMSDFLPTYAVEAHLYAHGATLNAFGFTSNHTGGVPHAGAFARTGGSGNEDFNGYFTNAYALGANLQVLYDSAACHYWVDDTAADIIVLGYRDRH